jgi:two-component system phosphate regulon response regulator OmpR
MPRLLLIDDDEQLGPPLATYFARAGFELVHATRPSAGLARLRGGGFDAVILDVMLPEIDGFELCRTIRRESAVPVVMLTARGEVMDRVVGLELGADDYLPKPFEPRELLARLRAILRRGRATNGPREVLRFGRLEIDRDARVVSIDGEERTLTSHQFELLWVLASQAGRVLSRDALMDRLRGHGVEAFDRSLDVHISRIRAAIEDDPKNPRRILTVRGAGYVFAREQH